ncbi:hypothetical protein ACFQ5J_08960 [Lacticaseibacillus baoqingensis]|uniref:Uncharacterized protein n=1 Tax=Lacticaseibacillus baoqingensis TaxID=2486013 RepID=A0ABW4E629_9LACO|nr:hypothetical protein [Lacticaseibacillus baoqingensis]
MTIDQITKIAEALGGLTQSEWAEVQRIIEHLYHPVKKALTSEEISASLIKAKRWL